MKINTKTAIVLYVDNPDVDNPDIDKPNANTPAFLHLAGEINAFLQQNQLPLADTELWLFYHQQTPTHIPEIAADISHIELIKAQSRYLPELFLDQLAQVQQQRKADLLLFAGDHLSSELATRLAFRLQGTSCLNIDRIWIEDQQLSVEKSVYGNNLTARFVLKQAPYCLAIARRAVKPAQAVAISDHCHEFTFAPLVDNQWVKQVSIDYPTEDVSQTANVVLAAGRGASQQAIRQLNTMAVPLAAYVGGSRPVALNGWVAMSHMLGVSGVRLSPALCLVAGASGSRAFTAGIRDSELIIAINNDANAPIFELADIAVIDDLEPVLTELNRLIASEQHAPSDQ